MESKSIKKEVRLLPDYFRIIGLVTIALTTVIVGILRSMDTEAVHAHKALLKILTFDALILGLWFMALSRDKIEDELTLVLRLRSMAWSFCWVVLYVVIRPVTDQLFLSATTSITGQELVISMLVSYMLMYYLQKRAR